MSRIERAIILAAGKGTRLAPITDNIPKPLISVNGKRMIESIIEALEANGIYEIYIVVGYKKESFHVLKEKYPTIRLIENPYYEECNNISSIYVAREHLCNTYIVEGDLNIRNAAIFSPECLHSGYNVIRVNEPTNEWVLQVDDKNIVTSCNRNGGRDGWQLYGISRWTAEDGLKLGRWTEEEFLAKKNINIYWDEIALYLHHDDFKLGIYKMKPDSVFEIDGIEELKAIDNSYKEGF